MHYYSQFHDRKQERKCGPWVSLSVVNAWVRNGTPGLRILFVGRKKLRVNESLELTSRDWRGVSGWWDGNISQVPVPQWADFFFLVSPALEVSKLK